MGTEFLYHITIFVHSSHAEQADDLACQVFGQCEVPASANAPRATDGVDDWIVFDLLATVAQRQALADLLPSIERIFFFTCGNEYGEQADAGKLINSNAGDENWLQQVLGTSWSFGESLQAAGLSYKPVVE